MTAGALEMVLMKQPCSAVRANSTYQAASSLTEGRFWLMESLPRHIICAEGNIPVCFQVQDAAVNALCLVVSSRVWWLVWREGLHGR